MSDTGPPQDSRVRTPSVMTVAIYSLLFNLALTGAKLLLSSLSGSLALRADAVHSLTDVLASMALILGLKISERKSQSFPLGLYKVENLASIAISFLLFFTAYEIFLEAVLGEAEPVHYQGFVIYAVAGIIPLPYLFGTFQIRVGERTGSPSLIADGVQHKADVLTSSLVFLALVAQNIAFPLDRIAAAIIALVIVNEGWKILVAGMRVILDASVDAKTHEKIGSLIIEAPEVAAIKELVVRNSGRYLFVEAEVTFRISDLKRAHLACEHIEAKIRKEFPQVDRVLIHYEPSIQTSLRYAVPLQDPRGTLSEHFGDSPYFALVEIDLKDIRLAKQEMIANPYQDLPKGKGLKVASLLIGHKPDIILAKESLVGKGPGYAFAESGIKTSITTAKSLGDLIESLLASRRENDR